MDWGCGRDPSALASDERLRGPCPWASAKAIGAARRVRAAIQSALFFIVLSFVYLPLLGAFLPCSWRWGGFPSCSERGTRDEGKRFKKNSDKPPFHFTSIAASMKPIPPRSSRTTA